MASVKDAIATMVKNIEEKTGKSVPAWIKLVQKTGLQKHKEIVNWLKAQQEMSHSYANYIALQALQAKKGPQSEEDQISGLFAGSKSALRPLYDQVIKIVQGFGKDIEIAPKKAYVSIRRSKQFALLQPSTATRIDLGLILKDMKPAGRLEASGSFNAMFTHRVRISSAAEINSELKGWLKKAYDAA
jgi:predicted ribosome quality control (RQC) complex YloA/Tae2 family protein